MWLHKRLTQGKRQKPVSISSSSTDKVSRMATLNHYWDNIPIKPIIIRVPAYSTLNKILEYFGTETIWSLHQKIYLRHLQPILLHLPPQRILPKANCENVGGGIHPYFLHSTSEMGSALMSLFWCPAWSRQTLILSVCVYRDGNTIVVFPCEGI